MPDRGGALMKAQLSTPTLLCIPEPSLGGWKARKEEAGTGGEVEICVILDWTSSVWKRDSSHSCK